MTPARRILFVGKPFNNTHAELTADLRVWSCGLRWERAYTALSTYLNLWTFDFTVPLLHLEVVVRHPKLP